jgi:hypothetical protein
MGFVAQPSAPELPEWDALAFEARGRNGCLTPFIRLSAGTKKAPGDAGAFSSNV